MSERINDKQLKKIISELSKLKSVKSSKYVSGEIERISGRLKDETFRIAVVGEFSSGKSTFINALIGKDVLSHARLETTATITYIKNVPKNDSKCGTCLVSFRDGTEKKLDSLEEIGNYTTAQSNNQVAERISSVTIYVNFLNSKHPVLIVDTPGLNGIAEHHREITLEEIKKAHTCIYLLSSSGISKSDTAFINLLRDYQDTFLFLQNFIDDLSVLEGDSAESKTAEDYRIIRESILNEGKSFNYKVIGISALKALASRDVSIKKLYSRDTREISDSDRDRYYKESNFSELEKHLENLIESDEYKRVIVDSAVRRLSIILSGLLGHLGDEQKINDQLRLQDDRNQRISAAKTAIEKMQNNSDDRERRLRNFVQSSCDKQLKIIVNYTKDQLHTIYDEVCRDIDDKIKTYDDFSTFSSKYGITHSAFYSRMITEKVNQKISSDIFRTSSQLLHHVYEQAVERIESYTNTQTERGKINLTLDALTDVFRMGESATLNTVDSLERDIAAYKQKISSLNMDITNQSIKLSDAENHVREVSAKLSACNAEKNSRIRSLGSRPEARHWTSSHIEANPRGGLFGGLADKISPRTKTVIDYHSDDSEGREWDKNKNKIFNEFRHREHEINNQLCEAKEHADSIRSNIELDRKNIKKAEDDIVFAGEQIKRQKEIYATEVKLSQNKFCEKQKQKLKLGIEEKMLNLSNASSAVSIYSDALRSMFEKNESVIENKSIDTYKKAVEEQKKMFEEIIKEDLKNLDERYSCNSNEINIISDIYCSLVPDTEGGAVNEQ